MLTAATAAWKLALVEPAATATEDGTVTDDELLDRLTTCPPVGAAAFSVTVQLSVAALVSDPLVQVRLPGIAWPVPLKVTVEVVPVEEFLGRVPEQLAAPAADGLKPIVRVAVWPAFSVSGKVTPERVYPDPLTEPALIVTAPVPEEVSVTD